MPVQAHLEEGLCGLGLVLAPERVALLMRYCALLQKWNRVYNLTAIREPSKLITHHLLDSLAVAPLLPGKSIVDLGSGAGLPGIPLAIARPEWQIVVLDSNHKKGAFLRQAVLELRLDNVDVQIGRAENWHPADGLDIAVSRAFSDLAGFIEAARHLVVPGGWFAAMKGVYPDEELALLPQDVTVESVTALHVPGLAAARHLVLLRSTSSASLQ